MQNDVQALISHVEQAVVGKTDTIKLVIAASLAGGHILLEDLPGMAKTLLAKTFAQSLALDFKRVQFTPDLLPQDLTGGYIFDRNKGDFQIRRGPIFTQVLLADEINRASPKTQSAMLEVMAEKQVTLEGETHPMASPYMVIATQNPVEFESTFPLPQAQMDRFLVRLSLGYPDHEDEVAILRQSWQGEPQNQSGTLSPQQVDSLFSLSQSVHVDGSIEEYIVRLATASRNHAKVAVGISPRGTKAMLALARAWAAMHGRSYVLPDDIKLLAGPCWTHRLTLEPEFWMETNLAHQVVEDLLEHTEVPLFDQEQSA